MSVTDETVQFWAVTSKLGTTRMRRISFERMFQAAGPVTANEQRPKNNNIAYVIHWRFFVVSARYWIELAEVHGKLHSECYSGDADITHCQSRRSASANVSSWQALHVPTISAAPSTPTDLLLTPDIFASSSLSAGATAVMSITTSVITEIVIYPIPGSLPSVQKCATFCLYPLTHQLLLLSCCRSNS